MTRIEFGKDVPEEYRAIANRWLAVWSWLLPPWLESVFVEYDRRKEGSAATITRDRYRNASLYLLPGLLEEGEYEQEVSIVHEICHFTLGPVQSVLERLIEKDDQFAQDTADHAAEQVVSDLSTMLVRHRRAMETVH